MSSMQKTTIPDIRKECPLCSKMGLVRAVEFVPGRGILYRSTHDDDSECQWSSFDGLEAMRSAKTDLPKEEIRCPECNEFGIIKQEEDKTDRAKRPDTWKYFVSHPRGQCLVTEENRPTILKKLGRYIYRNGEKKNGKRGKEKVPRVECLVCHKPSVRYNTKQGIKFEHRDEQSIGEYQYKGKKTYRYKVCNFNPNKVKKDNTILELKKEMEVMKKDIKELQKLHLPRKKKQITKKRSITRTERPFVKCPLHPQEDAREYFFPSDKCLSYVHRGRHGNERCHLRDPNAKALSGYTFVDHSQKASLSEEQIRELKQQYQNTIHPSTEGLPIQVECLNCHKPAIGWGISPHIAIREVNAYIIEKAKLPPLYIDFRHNTSKGKGNHSHPLRKPIIELLKAI